MGPPLTGCGIPVLEGPGRGYESWNHFRSSA